MKHIVFLISLFLFLEFSGEAWAEIIVIVHQDVTENSISAKELREIFLGKRAQWKDHSSVHPAIVKEETLHKAFLKQYLKKSPSQWVAHWKRMIFTGNGTPPEQFPSQEELLNYVAETPGAIGYLDQETAAENVTILDIQ